MHRTSFILKKFTRASINRVVHMITEQQRVQEYIMKSCAAAVLPLLLSLTDTHTHSHSALRWTFLSAGFPPPSALSRHMLQSADSNTLMSVSRLPSCLSLHSDCCRLPKCSGSLSVCILVIVLYIMHLTYFPVYDTTRLTVHGQPALLVECRKYRIY